MDWHSYVFIGIVIGFWAYHGLYLIILKTYARNRIKKEFFDIADEMGYKIIEKDS